MTRTLLSLATVMLSTVSFSQARSVDGRTLVIQGARATLSNIEATAASVARQADELSQPGATARVGWQVQAMSLNRMRDDLNYIGRNLRALEAEQGTLATWEQRALVETAPILKDAANHLAAAIHQLNQNQLAPWHTDISSLTAQVERDSQRVEKTIHAFLKLDKTRRVEERTQNELNSGL